MITKTDRKFVHNLRKKEQDIMKSGKKGGEGSTGKKRLCMLDYF